MFQWGFLLFWNTSRWLSVTWKCSRIKRSYIQGGCLHIFNRFYQTNILMSFWKSCFIVYYMPDKECWQTQLADIEGLLSWHSDYHHGPQTLPIGKRRDIHFKQCRLYRLWLKQADNIFNGIFLKNMRLSLNFKFQSVHKTSLLVVGMAWLRKNRGILSINIDLIH